MKSKIGAICIFIVMFLNTNLFALNETKIDGKHYNFGNDKFSNIFTNGRSSLLFKNIDDITVMRFNANPLYAIIDKFFSYYAPVAEGKKIVSFFALDSIYYPDRQLS